MAFRNGTWIGRFAGSEYAAVAALVAGSLTAGAQMPIAMVPVDGMNAGGAKVSGAVEVSNGNAVITNGGSITAGDRTAVVSLPGKGELRLCSTTTVHLSRDRSVSAPGSNFPGSSTPGTPAVSPVQGPTNGVGTAAGSAMMIAFDRGALEASYTTGKYSDVVMTPDFRILVSGPGQADLRIRVTLQGDTCIENHGEHAPYVTVSSQLEEGLYRVQPGQRVLFEHGSLREVVDHEQEPCGCPPPVSVASAAGQKARSDTAFPLAESEGLAPLPTPAPSSQGDVHTQVTAPLIYDGSAPPVVPVAGAEQSTAATANDAHPAPAGGVFHRLKRFFARLFGK